MYESKDGHTQWSGVCRHQGQDTFSDNCNRIRFGPSIPLSIDSTPLDAFHTLLSVNAMSNIILQWTERIRRDQCPHYAVITIDELNAFLGLLILFGTMKLSHIRAYLEHESWCAVCSCCHVGKTLQADFTLLTV